MHPSIQHVLQYFAFAHLPAALQGVSRPFSELAQSVADRNPDSPETTVALRKLLEAKDAAVRAALDRRVQEVVENVFNRPGVS